MRLARLAREGGGRQKQASACENNGGGKRASAREQWRKYSRDAADRLGRRPFLLRRVPAAAAGDQRHEPLEPLGMEGRGGKKVTKVYQLDTLGRVAVKRGDKTTGGGKGSIRFRLRIEKTDETINSGNPRLKLYVRVT